MRFLSEEFLRNVRRSWLLQQPEEVQQQIAHQMDLLFQEYENEAAPVSPPHANGMNANGNQPRNIVYAPGVEEAN